MAKGLHALSKIVNPNVGLYQRFYASFMARSDREQHRLYGARKRALFADLEGTVLEIGPGSGINLPYYPAGIRWIGVEPNPHMHPYIQEKAASLDLDVTLLADVAETMAVEDASVDAVVSTLVLCSVPDISVALAEIQRVLKLGGRFHFIEHIAAPEGTFLRKVQRGIKPLWKALADGCHPDRNTQEALDAAGFTDVHYEHFDLATMMPIKPHIIGVAIR